jgi:hypothetical protein
MKYNIEGARPRYYLKATKNMTAYIGARHISFSLHKENGEVWKGSLTDAKSKCKQLNKEQSMKCGLYPTYYSPIKTT